MEDSPFPVCELRISTKQAYVSLESGGSPPASVGPFPLPKDQAEVQWPPVSAHLQGQGTSTGVKWTLPPWRGESAHSV